MLEFIWLNQNVRGTITKNKLKIQPFNQPSLDYMEGTTFKINSPFYRGHRDALSPLWKSDTIIQDEGF